MDVELVTEGDENFMVNENNAQFVNFEGERCGICMDGVIDRGVLDCCQHWFCFTCIDNWATITNLCPLCQNEFQMITCVPVYDTIGSNKTDDELYSRDDDWCIEGENNTLSFPSYYIDENAVVCLEGDGCKIRSRSATFEDSVLDTSIACDACDVWYHAICVGFDPEGTCENSWHCPRCLDGRMPQHSDDDVPLSGLGSQKGPESGGSDCSEEASFSGKVSVSVADAGETAIVVSVVDGNQGSSEVGAGPPILDLVTNTKVDALLPSSVSDLSRPGEPPRTMISSSKQNSESEEVELSLSQNSCFSFSLPSTSPAADEGTEKPGLGSGLGDEIIPDKAEILSGGSTIPDKHVDIAIVTVAKRKLEDTRVPDAELGEAEVDDKVSSKRVKVEALEENSLLVSSKDYSSISDDDKFLTTMAENAESGCESEKNAVSSDIMNIVQETVGRRSKQAARASSSNVSSKERDNTARLRVKKIMRRTGDDADSSSLVQNLQKEIREAVRNKSSKEIGESIFDSKLLAAFRAAITGPAAESRKPPLDLKAKKALLQKGNVRENLTKKIYGVGGRRKRAWTRDCEVEFWKHRCSKISRPEKVQTLKSVLDLLRNDTGNREMKPGKDGEGNSILSRLYLADTSIFPRKNDIRPISAIRDDVIPEKRKEQNSPQNLDKNPPKNEICKKMVGSAPLESKQPKKVASGLKTEATSAKCQTKQAERPLTSQLGGSKLSSQKETGGASDGVKNDRRKWALELLARKTATNGPKEKEQDSVMLKGNYPLLAQLPKDIRPVLAPINHNKISISVRQAQLYRLTEHFLRKANLPVMCITAETELAVADAVNIEKEVANRSNSKLVYVNLCSQELSRRSDNMNLGREETTPTSASAVHSDEPEGNSDTSSILEVNEALKLAGLSDTPPSSPPQLAEDNGVAGSLEMNEDDGPDNVIEMDSQAELDIYGDFEYNFEDDDFIGANANAVKTSEPLQEGPRIKVLFSTRNLDNSNGSLDIPDHEGSAHIKPVVPPSGHECPMESGSSKTDCGVDDNQPQPQTKIAADEECGELSLAECEELYGPDKEPLVVKYPEIAIVKPCELTDGKETGMGNGCNGFCEAAKASDTEKESCTGCLQVSKASKGASGTANSPSHPKDAEQIQKTDKSSTANSDKQSDSRHFVFKKVEAYVKEHIRPLCKSGVITVEQYRWAVGKTTEKVMKFHSKEKNANFLIKEGEKVKKLAERYVESAQQTVKT